MKRMLPDFKLSVSAGRISGASTVFKFGKNQDISSSGNEDVISWGGLKLFPTAASTLSIASSTVNDDDGGTGINKIRIYGLDANYLEVTEEITLNGTSAVVTSNSYLRVTRMYGTLAGSVQRADGNIIATHDEGIISEIVAGDGQSADATYTVPANHVLMIDRIAASLERSATGAGAEIHFEIKLFGENTWREQADISLAASGTSHMTRDTDLWYSVPEKADVRLYVSNANTNSTHIAASFDAILIDLDNFAW